MRLNTASLWLTTMVVLAGCPGTEKKPQLSAVTVSCAPTSVAAGQTAQCTASATDQDGQPFTVSGYTWTSSNESVAKVDAAGKVTTSSTGTAAIHASATADGVTRDGQSTLTVTQVPPQLSTVTVSCDPTSVEVGQTAQCTASAKDQGGQPFTVSGYTWTSSNESVAKVDATGKVTTFSGGPATLTASATAGGITKQGQATVTVIQPTIHETSITANETWRAANNPHVVRGALGVTGATLTLEAGVELRFEQDAELRVTTGALRALGTQEAPIRMVARQSVPTKGYWRGVVFAVAGSDSELNHVTLSHCGGASGKSACLALENQAAPVLRHVAVNDSGTAGVMAADDGSAFGAESTTLSVSRSEGYAVSIGANQAGTLPSGGTFTDNKPQAIELRGNVSRSQTWPNLGLPLVVNSYVNIKGATNPTLTIAAGTVVRFGPETGLEVSANNGGALIVDGTEAAPVLLTADAASPQPGHWAGVFLNGSISSTTRLSHATIEYAGGGGDDLANLKVTGSDIIASPVIDHVTVRKGLHDGAVFDFASFDPSSTTLSAHDNGGYAIAVLAGFAGTIPTGGTFHGNARDAVRLIPGSAVVTTQTWPNLGIPYVINEFFNVGAPSSSPKPTLTLALGTELRFGPEGGISIGADGAPGILKASGTYEMPARFVPDAPTPTKGSWRGLHFWDAGGSLLDIVVVSHAGAGGPGASVGTGDLNVYKDIAPFVANSTISDAAGCGITVSDGTRAGTDNVTRDYTNFANTFSNNDGADQCKN